MLKKQTYELPIVDGTRQIFVVISRDTFHIIENRFLIVSVAETIPVIWLIVLKKKRQFTTRYILIRIGLLNANAYTMEKNDVKEQLV